MADETLSLRVVRNRVQLMTDSSSGHRMFLLHINADGEIHLENGIPEGTININTNPDTQTIIVE